MDSLKSKKNKSSPPAGVNVQQTRACEGISQVDEIQVTYQRERRGVQTMEPHCGMLAAAAIAGVDRCRVPTLFYSDHAYPNS
jgi:hypothetical protein